MEHFFAVITTFPNVVFTFLLGIVLVYWLIAVLGMVDIDLFPIEGDVDGVDVGAGLAGYLLAFGLAGVPVTVSISVLILWTWLFSYFATAYIVMLIPGATLQVLAGIAVAIVCLVVAVRVTSVSLRPMRGMFVSHQAPSKAGLIGKSVEITTLRVDADFGQAKLYDGGAGLILSVCAEIPNKLGKGEKAVIISYNKDKDVYFVISQEEFVD